MDLDLEMGIFLFKIKIFFRKEQILLLQINWTILRLAIILRVYIRSEKLLSEVETFWMWMRS
jgi:hypothetical protein